MKITVIGTGYVGLVNGAGLADLGNEVTCLDIDDEKISQLNAGKIPIYEPELESVVKKNKKNGRLKFTTNSKEAIEQSSIIYICVGTPTSGNDKSADMSYIFSAAKDIGTYINDYKIIINKSTVPVGTADQVKRIIKENQTNDSEFVVVSCPEFLKEGTAVNDFRNPDRIVIGVDDKKAKEILTELYKPFETLNKPILFCNVRSAEMIKYASNAMLATRISFMNELSALCEKLNADVKMVSKGMGLDSRIGSKFLQAGLGYGGSCFPKDARALVHMMRENECSSGILEAVDSANERQKTRALPKIKKLIDDLEGKTICILGLAFKPETDDIREAPSLVLINQLVKEGAKVTAYDPVASENIKKAIKYDNLKITNDPYSAADGSHGIILVTEWNEFKELDYKRIQKSMKTACFVDCRNLLDPEEMRKMGFIYSSIGRP
ncbi:UDP-glucose/GDP-mannose dehydrogenase family protein [Candidatus Woesearchaeota archaeon]|jgi:UDPglucose 6-dehydrogenase|nr:UDP-glucose/GDP-mannose dehydrogenase family protein [Candidatus Woesearchaeota archaeon]MBT3537588.1 UDP-glucose/GDP-mannose dehydrogenase family protein [Candidatus Woesearchaeota archaeon]MBT4696910.1 UDP-glucose/GDP-mannose dehydrogenase family protein [Candidatus Woesearchaeota archaeon]MBT4716430.1 UDP-glucose/GDP-mannose dehydrogenase family protein [Candidatus Woesearchaeota archaeon]MBT7105257.1 UDP-glucose/GDP-mannose dehydrogenase family protein [Candidatus Woesearchaeota archaeon